MSPTGGCGNRHQRLLAALLDPAAATTRGMVPAEAPDGSVPRIATWWEL